MAVASSTVAARPDRAQRAGEKWAPWLLLTPTLIILNVVGVYPLLHSLYLSFTGYRPTNPTQHQGWVGLDNYVRALINDQFWHAIGMTSLFTACSVVLSLALAIALALLFHRKLPGFVLMRSVILIPMLVTPIAVGLIWRIMMIPELGVLNYIFGLVGIDPLLWASSRSTAMISMILVDVWQWTPFMFIIIFAGLKSLPQSPFESALIDGAGPFMTFRLVTLPMLKPVITIAVLLRLLDAIRTYDTVYIVTKGGPDFATDLISIYLQRVNFRFFDLGYGAAASWLILLFVLIVVLVFVNLTGFLQTVQEKETR